MNDKYSNNEIYIMLKGLKETVEKGFKGVHSRQDTANGKVRKLEIWRGFITGGLAVMAIIVIPLAIFVFKNIK